MRKYGMIMHNLSFALIFLSQMLYVYMHVYVLRHLTNSLAYILFGD